MIDVIWALVLILVMARGLTEVTKYHFLPTTLTLRATAHARKGSAAYVQDDLERAGNPRVPDLTPFRRVSGVLWKSRHRKANLGELQASDFTMSPFAPPYHHSTIQAI